MSRMLFFGKGERNASLILLCLLLGGLALYLYAPAHSEISPKRVKPNQATGQASDSRDTIYTDKHYVGPPSHLQSGAKNKFQRKVVLDLNRVDSVTLIKVPGIGPTFAKRILALRERLGGYYTVMQLQEVYGVDADKYLALKGWFTIKTPPRRYPLSSLKADELPRHIYLNWEQQRTLNKLLHRHGTIRKWSLLMKEAAFTRDDSVRLSPYFVEQDSID